jgi:hypothetical protein
LKAVLLENILICIGSINNNKIVTPIKIVALIGHLFSDGHLISTSHFIFTTPPALQRKLKTEKLLLA